MFLGQSPSIVLSSVQAMVLPALLLALTVSAIIVVAGLLRRRDLLLRGHNGGTRPNFAFGQTPLESGLLDVAAEIRAVLEQLDGLAAQNFVEFELAVQPRLAIQADPRVFRDILTKLVVHAIDQAPGGRVLLGAARQGGRVLVTVSDEGAGTDRATQESALRPAERLAALQGASLEVDARAGQGTTVVLRLTAASTARRDTTAAEPTDPATIRAQARAPRQTTTATR